MRVYTEEEELSIVNLYKDIKSMSKIRNIIHGDVDVIKQILNKYGIFPSLRRQPLDVKYFEYIDSNEKAYWLGFIAADGCIQKSGCKLTFCVKDTDILHKFKESVGAGSPVRNREIFDRRTSKIYYQCNLQISSTEFCQYIKNHGVDENKSKVFNFPNIEEKYYSHFIRGLYDGDGSIHVSKSKIKGKINFRVNMISSLSCINYIKNYLHSININSEKIFSKHDQGIHYMTIGKDSTKFLEWIYKDSTENIRLNRKYEKYINNLDEYINQKRNFKITNHITNEEFYTQNLSEFARDYEFNPAVLSHRMIHHRISKSGRHKGLEIVEIFD